MRNQVHRAPVNRKTLHKVMRDNRLPALDAGDDESVSSDEANPLHDQLESCSVEQLMELKKGAFHQFDQDKYPKHRIEAVTDELLTMQRREPLRFTAPLAVMTARDIVAAFDAFFSAQPDGRDRQPLLLNIAKDTALYTRLRQWPQYEVIGDIFEPIHLALFGGDRRRRLVAPPPSLDTLGHLQSALILSHHQETPFRSVQLIEQLEHRLYSKLLDIYVNQRTATFVLEWNQSSPFVLIVCFGIVVARDGGDLIAVGDGDDPHTITVLNRETADELVTLTRDDLLTDVNVSDAARPSIGKKRKKAKLMADKEGQNKTTIDLQQRRDFLRACKLSYLYYGYMGRD
jgi:hypothetical protein